MNELTMPSGSPSREAGDIGRGRLMPDEGRDELPPPVEPIEGDPEVPDEPLPVDIPEVPVEVPVELPVPGRVVEALPEPIAVPPGMVLEEPVAPVEGVV